MVADEVGRAVAVYDGHLDVHEDDVGFRVRWLGGVGCGEVVESFLAVPDCGYFEAEFADCFQGYLLVDGTVFVSWMTDEGRVSCYLSSTTKIFVLALSSGDNSSSIGAGGVMLIDLGLRRIL